MGVAAQILIVEDELLLAEDIRIRLMQLKYEVIGIAETGTEALRIAQALRPDVILMDGTLQGSMDGFEAAKMIEQFLDCPIIYITSNPRASAMRYSIRKPFTAAAISAMVATALNDRHSDLA